MDTRKQNIIVELSFSFSLDIIEFVEALEQNKKYVLAKQLFRSGTSIGANIREAQNAESKNDFIHKMKIAAKETDETHYWLELCKASSHYPTNQDLIDKCEAIQKVLNKIISSSKNGLSQGAPHSQINKFSN